MTLRMPAHLVTTVHFPPRSSDGPAACACGWSGLASCFAQHRVDAKAGAAGSRLSNGLSYAPAVFVKRLPPKVAPVTPPDLLERVCGNDHKGDWHRSVDGAADCRGCKRDYMTRKRDERRKRVAA